MVHTVQGEFLKNARDQRMQSSILVVFSFVHLDYYSNALINAAAVVVYGNYDNGKTIDRVVERLGVRFEKQRYDCVVTNDEFTDAVAEELKAEKVVWTWVCSDGPVPACDTMRLEYI